MRSGSPGGGHCLVAWAKRWHRLARVVVFGGLCMALMWQGAVSPCQGQPPGTPPPEQAFEPVKHALPINAFLFLDESKNQVVMPGLSWEELQRLQDLADGRHETGGRYSFESLRVIGKARSGRADLQVEVRLSVQATGNQFVNIPLRMNNFHQIAPPEIKGAATAMLDVMPDGSGYELKVKSPDGGKSESEVTVLMKVTARVDSAPNEHLELRLPFSPTHIELTAPIGDVKGEVIGNGDETIESIAVDEHTTRMVVNSSGGNFSLRWGHPQNQKRAREMMEVESRVSVRWDSPQDQPVAEIRLSVRSVKGAIRGFQIKLPPGSVVIGTPRLGAGGQAVELRPVEPNGPPFVSSGPSKGSSQDANPRESPNSTKGSTPEQNIYDVVIPEEEFQNRIDLNFDLQLEGTLATSDAPLMMQVPEVIGALKHRGEIVFSIGRDYRLRWQAQPWVQSESVDLSDDSSSQRLYPFRFDRQWISLPVWLTTGTRRLQLTSQADLTIRDAVATIEMNIKINGSAINSRLRIDPATWEFASVEQAGSGAPVEWFESESIRVIELGAISGESDQAIRIVATLPIGQDLGEVSFPIPRIVGDREEFVLRRSTIDVIRNGRTMMIVDLTASDGLTRMTAPSSSSPETLALSESRREGRISRFRLSQSELVPFIAGTLVDQPPQVTLATTVDVGSDADSLVTVVNWELDSAFDLEGRMPIQIPSIQAVDRQRDTLASQTGGGNQDGSRRFEGMFDVSGEYGDNPTDATGNPVGWAVSVDGLPATLRQLDADRYEVISDQLASGSMSIRWRRTDAFPEANRASPQPVSIPRPDLADVTLRGKVEITLHGTNTSSWTAIEYAGQTVEVPSSDIRSAKRLELDVIPREPLRFRLQPNQAIGEERSVLRTVLRTAYSSTTRHEQMLMTFQGGDALRIELPAVRRGDVSMDRFTVEAEIDGNSIVVAAQEHALILTLPGDQAKHQIDLRVWVDLPVTGSINRVEPLMKLPIGVGRIYWQVIAPHNAHVMWSSPSVGRAMSWRFDQWRLYREPSFSDPSLVSIAGGTHHAMPTGNRYLYLGSDLSRFETVVFSRTILWAIVAMVVILFSAMLMYVPATRHPLTAMLAGAAFTFLLVAAPDAAVLSGQFAILSLALVAVMMTVRALLAGTSGDRLFDTPAKRDPRSHEPQSTREEQEQQAAREVTETHELKPSSRFPAKAGAGP